MHVTSPVCRKISTQVKNIPLKSWHPQRDALQVKFSLEVGSSSEHNHFFFSISSGINLGSLQTFGATSSVSAMINQLQWPTLQDWRAQAKATMNRIVYNLVDIPHTFLTPIVVLRGYSSRYVAPFTRTGVYRQTFFPDSIRIWNGLPQDLVNCAFLTSFKQGVQSVQLC